MVEYCESVTYPIRSKCWAALIKLNPKLWVPPKSHRLKYDAVFLKLMEVRDVVKTMLLEAKPRARPRQDKDHSYQDLAYQVQD